MEENRNFSWTDLFIKVILVVIFVLFTVWLLSLGNKDMSNSLDVLTNNIFFENMEKMKNVGKEYFTIERLPEKVGDVKTLTLEEMYEKKLLLELTDKNGNACSAKNSYVSVEKYENEYQMKVFLECGEESDHIIVIMGCYNYCDTDICEFDKDKEEIKEIEYQYKKTTGGKWSDWGKWSEWSKVSVTKENYREVETRIGTEEYSYDKTVTETKYAELQATCPSGYEMQGNTCVKENMIYDYQNPVCPDRTSEGFTLSSQNGFTCKYSKNVTNTTEPLACVAKDGWTVIRNGLTCTYTTTVKVAYQEAYQSPYQVVVGKKLVSSCSGCAAQWQTIYETRYETKYRTAYKTETKTETGTTSCPSGYNYVDGVCTQHSITNETKTATCKSGYNQKDNTCVKTETNYIYENTTKSCPSGYSLTSDEMKCYTKVSTTETVTNTREVTYYRYRIREYIGGTTDYKWSTSKNDKKLLDAGYKLTGKTR